jgi:hypothetical protein
MDAGTVARRALMIVGPSPLVAIDLAIQARLTRHLPVDVIADEAATARDTQGKALVLITSSASVAGTGTKFRDVAVPLMVLEPNIFGVMRLTAEASRDHGTTARKETQIRIIEEDHPLAAGYSGDVPVYRTPWRLSWGVPSPQAIAIATVVDDPGRVVIFAYLPGAEMVGGAAPAKRMAFFLHENTVDNLTMDALLLLDAAIAWMLD